MGQINDLPHLIPMIQRSYDAAVAIAVASGVIIDEVAAGVAAISAD